MTRHLAIAVSALVLDVLLAGCGAGSGDDGGQPTTPTITWATPSPSAMARR